jgi:hypothetical protein
LLLEKNKHRQALRMCTHAERALKRELGEEVYRNMVQDMSRGKEAIDTGYSRDTGEQLDQDSKAGAGGTRATNDVNESNIDMKSDMYMQTEAAACSDETASVRVMNLRHAETQRLQETMQSVAERRGRGRGQYKQADARRVVQNEGDAAGLSALDVSSYVADSKVENDDMNMGEHESSFMNSIEQAVDRYAQRGNTDSVINDDERLVTDNAGSSARDSGTAYSSLPARGIQQVQSAQPGGLSPDRRSGASSAMKQEHNSKRSGDTPGGVRKETGRGGILAAYDELDDVYRKLDFTSQEDSDEGLDGVFGRPRESAEAERPIMVVYKDVGVGRGMGRLSKVDLSMRERELGMEVQRQKEREEMAKQIELRAKQQAEVTTVPKKEVTLMARYACQCMRAAVSCACEGFFLFA